MTLSYNDMMFECIFNNTENKLTQKTSKKSKTSKTSKKSKTKEKEDVKLFNNNKNDFNNLYNFYSKYNYESITQLYNKLKNIIVDTKNNEEKKWNYTTGFLLYGVNYYFIHRLSNIIIPGDEGISNFIDKFKKITKFIKNDNNTPSYIKSNYEDLINFEKNIHKNKIIFNTYELLPLTNNKYLTSFTVKIIDILNRYFKYFSEELYIINVGFYIPNDDETVDYIKSKSEEFNKIKYEIDNTINTINQYRSDKISTNFEIKYQTKHPKLLETELLNKLNLIITVGQYFTYNNKKLLEYLNKKLIEGGNLILVCNMNTPIKSDLVKLLLQSFKKSIITKATLDDSFNWVFIGKGFISVKNTNVNEDKIMNFINNSFNKSCINFNNFLNNIEKTVKLSNSMLVNQINKKYIEIYRWCLNNNINAINLFSDFNKEPKLVEMNKAIDYFFPDQKGVNKKNIKIFDISVYSVTLPQEANLISLTIKKLLNTKNNNIIITDGTANVGGNTLSFSTYFYKVNSIEYNKKTYDGLVYNCNVVYKRHNITFYEGDCTKIIPRLQQDVIFIDPPWDGLFYKAYDKLHLSLGDKDIFDIVLDWYNNKKAKLYCIKCPFNFAFEPFIKQFSNIYIQKLKNWNVIYIIA